MFTPRFDIVREDLHRRYDSVCAPERIDEVLDAVIAENQDAKVPDFLPIIVEREASERLEADSEGKPIEARREVLFVDQRNTGRSQIASALLRHHNGEGIFSRSVGLAPEGEGIDPQVLAALKERGIETRYLYQKQLVARTVHRSDVIVLLGVADRPHLPGHRYESWDIADPEGKSAEEIHAIIDDLDAHIQKLIASLS